MPHRRAPRNAADPPARSGLPGPPILRQADTLQLTGPQADSLATMNRRHVIRLDSIWTPLVREMAALRQ